MVMFTNYLFRTYLLSKKGGLCFLPIIIATILIILFHSKQFFLVDPIFDAIYNKLEIYLMANFMLWATWDSQP